MNKGKRSRSRHFAGKKQRYRTPELAVHGDVTSLTRAKKGKTSDGFGKPKTRMSIFNA